MPKTLTLSFVAILCASAWSADTIEFLNGSTVTGQVIAIRKANREFDFNTDFGGKQIRQTYPYDKIHAVTRDGKRFVINPMDSGDGSPAKQASRSKQQVLDIIATQGSTDPEWLAATKANYPASLELDWPLKAEGAWNESKNVGQYLWGRVNPNVSRWKPGIKLIYQIIQRHENDPALLQRDQQQLGEMYFTLFQDYARAAYWLQKSKPSVSKPTGIHLAECYWRLGNKDMAMEMMREGSVHVSGIKLLGDMDEIDKAMKLAEVYAKTSLFNVAFLHVGDALRKAGRLDEAIVFYQKVLDRNTARNPEYLKRYRGLASDAIAAIRLNDKTDVSRCADGTYSAQSMGYNGPVEVQVRVAGGRMTDVKVTKHREKQFFAALTDTPRQIILAQDVQKVDGVTGATITSQAILHSTAQALAQGAP